MSSPAVPAVYAADVGSIAKFGSLNRLWIRWSSKSTFSRLEVSCFSFTAASFKALRLDIPSICKSELLSSFLLLLRLVSTCPPSSSSSVRTSPPHCRPPTPTAPTAAAPTAAAPTAAAPTAATPTAAAPTAAAPTAAAP
eukprot:Lankesteria_metandrocarpae@DN8629_c0_g1_i2.p2